MKRDWVVWVVSLLLFLTGWVWGSVALKTDFFTVASVHDLFDIASSIATIFAVVVAFFGLNAWRVQKKAELDHDMARRILVSLARYEELVSEQCVEAGLCSLLRSSDLESQPGGYLVGVLELSRTHREVFMQSRAELVALLQEAGAMWGGEFLNEYFNIISKCDLFSNMIDLFSKFLSKDNPEFVRMFYQGKFDQYEFQFHSGGWGGDDFADKVVEISEPLRKFVGEKLIK